jgi:hypothetical protein
LEDKNNLDLKIKVSEQAELSHANPLNFEENEVKLVRTVIVQTEIIRTDIFRTRVYIVTTIPTCLMLPYDNMNMQEYKYEVKKIWMP